MGSNRRKYTKEFKQKYLEFLLRAGKPARKVAAELGINQEMLSRWRREYETHQEKAFPGQGKPIEAELAQLRRELADVTME
ncbi:transposase [Oceanispirochaeta sp.]|jgi:transposase|uniref:transposase n=1 Tax=Oceanispirochaeta sp. TaxID=2035350 RepID=UPI002637134C|nr:transposase [Oceanispirochaeta sp.]MDA3957441.1 transposase [Oceanispirochaeta sp.]